MARQATERDEWLDFLLAAPRPFIQEIGAYHTRALVAAAEVHKALESPPAEADPLDFLTQVAGRANQIVHELGDLLGHLALIQKQQREIAERCQQVNTVEERPQLAHPYDGREWPR